MKDFNTILEAISYFALKNNSVCVIDDNGRYSYEDLLCKIENYYEKVVNKIKYNPYTTLVEVLVEKSVDLIAIFSCFIKIKIPMFFESPLVDSEKNRSIIQTLGIQYIVCDIETFNVQKKSIEMIEITQITSRYILYKISKVKKCVFSEKDLQDVAYLNRTSGTTEKAKICLATNKNLAINTRANILIYEPKVYTCLFSPEFHVHELFFRPLYSGGIAILSNLTARNLCAFLQKNRVEHILGVPYQIVYLLKSFVRSNSVLNRIECAGSKLTFSFYQQIINYTGCVPLQAWGSTETSGVAIIADRNKEHFDSSYIGKILEGYYIEIVKQKNENEMYGEMVMRGEAVVETYLDSDGIIKHTNRVIHTKDLVNVDEEENIYLWGRKNHVMKILGNYVYPEEIESIVLSISEVKTVKVISYKFDDDFMPIAFVIKEDGKECTTAKIIECCVRNLEPYKVPKKILFLKEFPYTENGKVNIKELEHLASGS